MGVRENARLHELDDGRRLPSETASTADTGRARALRPRRRFSALGHLTRRDPRRRPGRHSTTRFPRILQCRVRSLPAARVVPRYHAAAARGSLIGDAVVM